MFRKHPDLGGHSNEGRVPGCHLLSGVPCAPVDPDGRGTVPLKQPRDPRGSAALPEAGERGRAEWSTLWPPG